MEETGITGRRLRMPSPAMTVACLALAVALSGVSYAAVALPRNSVGTAQLKRNAVTSPKVRDNALTGNDINEARLGQVPSAARANSANTANSATAADSANTANTAASATNAANADRLDSLDSTAFMRTGAVRVAFDRYTQGQALPFATNDFTSQGGRLLITFSATGFRSAVGLGCILVQVFAGSTPVSGAHSACLYFNQISVHAALQSRTVYVDLPPGTYHLNLTSSGVLTDAQDFVAISVLEIP
jgi:hypothetical protein